MSDRAAELAALYRDVLLDHGRKPRHAAIPEPAERVVVRDNPLCGDRVALGLRFDGERIVALGAETQGCLIATAAASLMCQILQSSSRAAARALCARYLSLVAELAPSWPDELGPLCAFAAVSRFPARASCATLAFAALRDALDAADAG